MEYLLIFTLGAYAYHLRGSAGPGGRLYDILGQAPGTQLGRLLWTLVFTMATVGATGNPWLIFIAPFAFLGVLPGYFGGQFDLWNKTNRNAHNYGLLSLRGMFICFPAMVGLGIAHATGLHDGGIGGFGVMAGALFVPCYLFGRVLYNFNVKLPLIVGWAEWGQALLGGCILTGWVMSV